MIRALCNATAEGDNGHIHICTLEHSHKGKVKDGIAHLCKCGAIFASVKKSDIERAGKTLQKTQ